MDETISTAIASITRAKDQMSRALATTPDDKVNWSPSATARTPVQIVAHSAEAIKNLHSFMDGKPFDAPDSFVADKMFREWEMQFTTREQAQKMLDENCANYVAFLEKLDPSKLDTMVKLPFGLGEAPLRIVTTFPPAHTTGHTAQIDYMQTIYGDLDWHMPAR